jgi:hypothetical protein
VNTDLLAVPSDKNMKEVDMKKALLYKPQTDDIGVNVAVYANEAFVDWGCGKRCKDIWPEGFDIFCRKKPKPAKNDNQICPRE